MEISSDEEDSSCEVVESVKTNIEKLSTKSGKLYEATYKAFMKWRECNNTDSFSEDTLLVYFRSLAEKYKSSSLWAHYSKLRGTLEVYHNVKLETYGKLRAFLKRRAAGYQAKKTKKFTLEEINGFIRYASDHTYLATKVALIMGVIGACKCTELKEMKVSDLRDLKSAMSVNVQYSNSKGIRNFILTGDFYEKVKKYVSLRPSDIDCPYLFLNYRKGKCIHQRMGINKFSAMGKQVATFLKLPNPKMYNGLSFRSSSATLLVDAEANFLALKNQVDWMALDPSKTTEMKTNELGSPLQPPTKTEEYNEYSLQNSSDMKPLIQEQQEPSSVTADEGYIDGATNINLETQKQNHADSANNSSENFDSRYWSKEITANFIEIYKSYPCLWKIKSREYTDRNLKVEAYDKLVEFCKLVNPEANREYVVKKIQSFRASFRKEYRKLKDSRRDGNAGSDKIYTPRLWYFDLLMFTTDQEQTTSNRSFDENTDEGEEEIWIKNELPEYVMVEDDVDDWIKKEKSVESENNEETTNLSLKNVSSLQQNKNQISSLSNSKANFQKKDSINEYDAVAISWAEKLKRMNPTQAIYAEMLVNKVIAQGLLNQLNKTTDIRDESPTATAFSQDSYSQQCTSQLNLSENLT